MKIFISWSGTQSKQIAESLRAWLPMVIQAVRPYMSERDNEAGARWGSVVAEELENSDFGIICLTRNNLDSHWIHFEAGALSKAVDRGHVVPLLFKLGNTDVGPPLSQFMMKPASKEGILAILKSINQQMEESRRLEDATLLGIFDAMWPRLEAELQAVPAEADPAKLAPQRTDRELLQEILELLRAKARTAPITAGDASLSDRALVARMSDALQAIMGPHVEVEVTDREVTMSGVNPAELDDAALEQMQTIRTILNSMGLQLFLKSNDDLRRPSAS